MKYELLKDDKIFIGKHELYRIKSLTSFKDVKVGDLGGYIESEYNLPQDDNSWIYSGKVYGFSKIRNNTTVIDSIISNNTYLSRCEINNSIISNTNAFDLKIRNSKIKDCRIKNSLNLGLVENSNLKNVILDEIDYIVQAEMYCSKYCTNAQIGYITIFAYRNIKNTISVQYGRHIIELDDFVNFINKMDKALVKEAQLLKEFIGFKLSEEHILHLNIHEEFVFNLPGFVYLLENGKFKEVIETGNEELKINEEYLPILKKLFSNKEYSKYTSKSESNNSQFTFIYPKKWKRERTFIEDTERNRYYYGRTKNKIFFEKN